MKSKLVICGILILALLAVLALPFQARAQGGNIGSNSSPIIDSSGRPRGGVNIAICQPLTTTAATVTSGVAVLTMASNPVTAGFVAGMQVSVSGFSGADTYFNVGATILSVSSTTITYALTHANANASSNGTALQTGNSTTPCAGLSAIFSDPAMTSATPNPFQSTGLGNWNAFAAPGVYYAQFYGSGIATTINQFAIGCVPGTTTACPSALPGFFVVNGTTFPRTCAGINQMIAAAPTGNGAQNPAAAAGAVIYLGFGDIPCSTTIIMDKPITLRGSGVAGRIVPQPGFAGPVIEALVDSNSITDNFGAGIGGRLENIWIEDVNFRSQNTDGIWLLHQAEFMMYNVEVKWLKGYALQLDNNGNNNTPVRECVFRNFISWGNGDPAQSKASIMMVTNSFPGSDEINEIRFEGGGVKSQWWEAIHIDTGQTPGVGLAKGPRHIYFDNFQVEARQDLDCANCTTAPAAVAPFSDNIHIVYGNNLSWQHSSISNAGQGKTALRIDGDANNPVREVVVRDSAIGGSPQLSGTVNTSATGNTVTWVSGNTFLPVDSFSWTGLTIVINGVNFTVSAINSATSLTLTTNPGNQSGVSYTVTSGGFGITTSWLNNLVLEGVNWIGNPTGNLNPTIVGTNNYQILELPGTAPGLASNDVFGDQQCFGTACAMGFQNNSPGGQRWSLNSANNGSFTISPATGNGLSPFILGGTARVFNSLQFREVGAGTLLSTAGFGDCYEDSTDHYLRCNLNGFGPHKLLIAELGQCSMSAGTTCTWTAQNSFVSTPLCFVNATTSPATAVSGSCAISGTTVTVTAGASNSLTWNAVLFGTPN